MLSKHVQAARAESFRKQHQGSKLLILPNIWDAMGAKLMEKIGYPSIATASVATAIANGYLDGENIPFNRLLEIVEEICSAVQLPVTVDIERGFADNVPQLKENIRLLIDRGASRYQHRRFQARPQKSVSHYGTVPENRSCQGNRYTMRCSALSLMQERMYLWLD